MHQSDSKLPSSKPFMIGWRWSDADSEMPPISSVVGAAFGRNLMVLGTVIFGVGAYGTFKGAMTLSWPHATATITNADLLRQSVPATRREDGTAPPSRLGRRSCV